MAAASPAADGGVTPRRVRQVLERSDITFRGTTRVSGALVVSVMVLIGAFLTLRSIQAISKVGLLKFLTTQQWSPATLQFGIAALVTDRKSVV